MKLKTILRLLTFVHLLKSQNFSFGWYFLSIKKWIGGKYQLPVKFQLFILLSFLSNMLFAQGKFRLTVEMPLNIAPNQLQIDIDNGEYKVQVKDTLRNGHLFLTDSFFAQYATISFIYLKDDSSELNITQFFIDSKPSSIKFALKNEKLTLIGNENAINVDKLGGEKMKQYCFVEEKNLMEFAVATNGRVNGNDSLTNIIEGLSKKLTDKKYCFIKENLNHYFAFWLFRTDLVKSYNFTGDTLQYLFNRFPSNFKNSREGKFIQQIINGKKLEHGQIAPDFTTKDILGNQIRLRNFNGKPVILDFWASYCGPCLKKITILKEIEKLYPSKKLSIISISNDRDSLAFIKALKMKQMDWTQIFNDYKIAKLYGENQLAIFLLNKEGEIIYMDKDEELGAEISLDILKRRLAGVIK